ncbi:MAG: phospho-sugar mutase [Flavobacteriales bacterium TMED96]|nr:MAG: phospho-sugar mutase [Flavobacteriales bacterium TMED96]RPG57495.1 MAG: phospho-sugar mutase [Flavobacteriales bacterium TMED96]|tara:strand:- start:5607 stop:7292 length:1686 start_codon:yes stop_codon:yes gene_type:complete
MKIADRVSIWKNKPFDKKTIKKIIELEKNEDELNERFHSDLEFGTGGIRGVMGIGSNRINKYTISKFTQGLADHLNKTLKKKQKTLIIAYDNRRNSKFFSNEVAKVLSANNFNVILFDDVRPTPLLSFSIRHFNADGGIMITASHNPPEYNGYKVYNSFGGQIVPPDDKKISESIKKLNFNKIKWDNNKSKVKIIDDNFDKIYFKKIISNSVLKKKNREKLKIVYSSLHGTGIKSIPPLLNEAGYKDINLVENQCFINENFLNTNTSNPEDKSAFEQTILLAEKINGEIIITTDPDADRLGVGVRDFKKNWVLLNGNQLMVLFLSFLLEKEFKKENFFVSTTLVSSPLFEKIAKKNKIECKLCHTGFKWIADVIEKEKKKTFLCGGEESFGFLHGNEVRDKDAASASLLFCDMFSFLKSKGETVISYLIEIYKDYGFYYDKLYTITRKGRKGAAEIKKQIEVLRLKPPKTIAGINVSKIDDFKTGLSYLKNGKIKKIDLPKTNLIIYYLEENSRISVRPSGTEPKIKFYINLYSKCNNTFDLNKESNKLEKKVKQIIKHFN